MQNHSARFLAAVAVAVCLAATAGPAAAQDSTTGALTGVIRDAEANEVAIGATVVATSPALQGEQRAFTEEDGVYLLPNLPPGTYTITVYYLDGKTTRNNALVWLGKVTKVNISVSPKPEAGEIIEVEGRPPLIDQLTTKTGTTVRRDFTENIPNGRTFGAVLGAAAGSADDLFGVSFSGSGSLENTYIVDGLNTTDPAFGLLTTDLPNEFVEETEVITGGYNAEYGRSTGGVVNVLTKTGSNEFHGSVFSYYTPGQLVAQPKQIPGAGSAIDAREELKYDTDFGAELGGPIVKDRLWFHVGFNPSFTSTNLRRTFVTQVDREGGGCDLDGDGTNDITDGDCIPDTDANGFPILEEIPGAPTETRIDFQQQYYYTAKLTGAVNPDHQGSLSLFGFERDHQLVIDGNGSRAADRMNRRQGILDLATKWTSKFNRSKSQVDVVVGLHRDRTDEEPGIENGDGPWVSHEFERPITFFERYEPNGIPDECRDGGPDDMYPGITNCPARDYAVGGPGILTDTTAVRLSGSAIYTQRGRLAGQHELKLGVDVEEQAYDHSLGDTGDAGYIESADGSWLVQKLRTASTSGSIPCGPDIDGDGMFDASCTDVAGDISASTHTRNLAAFVRDSWSILPNLTLNAGVRWEQQTVFVADEIAGEISTVTGQPVPEKAFTLNNLIAPRVGVIYDWTEEGRSRVYAHYGRFYESIPMDVNSTQYGGEIIALDVYLPGGCSEVNPSGSCDPASQILTDPNGNTLLTFGATDALVDPDLKAQYLDEVILGSEYEVIPNLKVGASLVYRDLGRAVEDISTDGGSTYLIANPGEVHEDSIAELRAEAESERMAGNDGRAAFLDYQADNLAANRFYDKPHRTYQALQLTAEHRFSGNLFVTGSYTYSRLRGNHPGLFSPETGQINPNITSMYDLPELMANRYGPLAGDQPHLLKVDGYYMLPLESIGQFVFGASGRLASGIPHNHLAGHFAYGKEESFLLPRGEGDRSPPSGAIDLHVAYGHVLDAKSGVRLEGFVDVFNVLNMQTELDADQEYSRDNANPIVGGDKEDLAHAKTIDDAGFTTSDLVDQQPNFGNLTVRQAPIAARFGMRLVF